MTEKKDKTKRQTKAGMLGKADGESKSEKDKSEMRKDSENLPGMSKEKAEERNEDRPVH